MMPPVCHLARQKRSVSKPVSCEVAARVLDHYGDEVMNLFSFSVIMLGHRQREHLLYQHSEISFKKREIT